MFWALFVGALSGVGILYLERERAMGQIVRAMSKNMIDRIEHQRSWVKGHLTEESTLKYDTIEGKLLLLQGIIDADYYQKEQAMELQSLGVTLGDSLVQSMDLEWVEVEDEYGLDPALRHKDTETYKNILLFPLTMISKRIEDDEAVNVETLYRVLCNTVQKMIDGCQSQELPIDVQPAP